MSEKMVAFSNKRRETIVKKDKASKELNKEFQRAFRKEKKQHLNDTCKDYEDGDRHGRIRKVSQKFSDLKRTASNWNAKRYRWTDNKLFQKIFVLKNTEGIY